MNNFSNIYSSAYFSSSHKFFCYVLFNLITYVNKSFSVVFFKEKFNGRDVLYKVIKFETVNSSDLNL